jgi:hypothetical protein
MKTIKFTDEEVEFLREQYYMELEEAEKYIQKIKTVLDKLGVPPTTKEPISDVKIQKKRGRKPKSVEEKVEIKVVKKKRRTRSDKGGSRLKPKQKTDKKESVLPASESKPPKKVVPKKKTRKKRNFKSGRVVLAPLSKPLKIKKVVEVPTAVPVLTETILEKAEEKSTS